MACLSKLQVIHRGKQNRQHYLIRPAPLAAALELGKGGTLARVEVLWACLAYNLAVWTRLSWRPGLAGVGAG